jgi:broad specificity phosphatase PhoE
MSKKIFNPKDWASPNTTANTASKPPVCANPKTDIETVTARIEAAVVDIAPNYADWRDLGFALADALGESGRSYYHRLSRFYSGYAENETDNQYDNCLKAHGHGVTIKTLYHLAKSAGIEIAILPIIQNGNLAKVAKPKVTPPQKAPEKTS